VRSTPYLRHVAETWHIWCDVAEQALVEAERPSNASSIGARLNIQQLSQSSKYITFMNRVEHESTVRISGVIWARLGAVRRPKRNLEGQCGVLELRNHSNDDRQRFQEDATCGVYDRWG